MKKICFVVPDGTGIRNYLYSNLLRELLLKDSKIILLHNLSKDALKEIYQVNGCEFEAHKLKEFKESIFQKFLREVVCYARLLHNKNLVQNPSLLDNWKPNTANFKKKLFYKTVMLFGKLIYKKYNWILKFENTYYSQVGKSSKKQQALLKEINPDVIFCTHQRAMIAVPLITAAQKMGIVTIGAIFSWDNLPKARLTVKTDKYVVWSAYMAKELHTYYPEIPKENIHITGTPQFEFYYNTKFIPPKSEFFETYLLNPNKKIICFSGDDERTSPFDPHYLEDMAQTIEAENLDIQILLRRAPVDVSGRFDAVIQKYPNTIKEAAPIWHLDKENTGWQTIYPLYKDIDLLVSTVFYADAVINVGSTMAHDFAMFQKPAIYINYNTVKSQHWNIKTIYQFQHFRSMQGLQPVLWLNSKEDISKVLIHSLEQPKLDNSAWLNRIAEHRETASKNIANLLMICT